MEEIPLHNQSNGPTSERIHSLVWEKAEPDANRGSLVVRQVTDANGKTDNTRDARFTPYLYERIHADWFLDIRRAYSGKVDEDVGDVVDKLESHEETADGQKPPTGGASINPRLKFGDP